MKTRLIKEIFYVSFIVSIFTLSVMFLYLAVTISDWHDFDVFYYAAKAALNGDTIYIIVGQYNLPFWYFPWTAWFYIPFAIWPHKIGLILYQFSTLFCAIAVIRMLTRYYNAEFKILDTLLIIALVIPMSAKLVEVGQMDYILLALLIAIIFAIERKMDILAGILIPFIWTKPHLVIVFTAFAFYRSGKRTVFISIALTLFMLLLETVLNPNWHIEMLNLLQAGAQRTKGLPFTTFPSLFGFQENWVGTANLPVTIALIAIAFAATWYFRSMPVVPFLSLALTASMFCAPRAHAYDFPLLIPAMIWLTHRDFIKNSWIWFIAVAIPLFSRFNSVSYLVTLLVFLFSLWKAYKTISNESHDLIA